MRKYLICFIVIVSFLTILGYMTNPSYEDFKDWYKERAQIGFTDYKEGRESTEFEKSVVNFFADMIVDSIVRDDHKLYSLYTTDNYKVLGMFNNFFILEDSVEKSTGVNTLRQK